MVQVGSSDVRTYLLTYYLLVHVLINVLTDYRPRVVGFFDCVAQSEVMQVQGTTHHGYYHYGCMHHGSTH